jgi:hypothetical protein
MGWLCPLPASWIQEPRSIACTAHLESVVCAECIGTLHFPFPNCQFPKTPPIAPGVVLLWKVNDGTQTGRSS